MNSRLFPGGKLVIRLSFNSLLMSEFCDKLFRRDCCRVESISYQHICYHHICYHHICYHHICYQHIPYSTSQYISYLIQDANREGAIVELMQEEPFSACESVIVYCLRREQTEQIASLLRTVFQVSLLIVLFG